MRVSHVGGEGRGEILAGMAIVNFAWISACVKAGLAAWMTLITQISKWKPKKRMEIACLNTLPVLEDSVSMCLSRVLGL